MKFSKDSVGILIVLSHKELSRIGILEEIKKVTGRDMRFCTLFDSLEQLFLTELISIRSENEDSSSDENKVYFKITPSGRQILKSIKTGLYRRGKLG